MALDGALELRAADGSKITASAGQTYHNMRGIVHETANVGSVPAKTVAVFVIDKGLPTTQPVIAPKQ